MLSLWKKNVNECKKLPKIIITGPSNTGSNELIKFISINRSLRTSENQTNFYSDEGYYKGFDWYLGSFDVQDKIQNYDRSDDYFSDPKVPERIKALVGEKTKIILFLMNPIERAYHYYKV